MRTNDRRGADRGQAFTLEGFIGAIVVLTAVLFALQAVVITPTSGGTIDRSAQAQIEQEVKDTLLVAENDDNLSRLVRYYNDSADEWQNASTGGETPYNNTRFRAQSNFGEILDEHFVEQRGSSFNVEYVYLLDKDGNRSSIDVVKMGGGRTDSAVSASYTVTLYDEQTLTVEGDDGPKEGSTKLEDASNYPIPNVDPAHPVYNVVEVRVTVW